MFTSVYDCLFSQTSTHAHNTYTRTGAQFGYHPGGWGKPPVDEEGNPVYGDVFGMHLNDAESDDEVCKREIAVMCLACT